MHSLSIVTTLYRSAEFIPEFIRRVSAAALEVTGDFEIVLVDDGSPDESLAVALAEARREPRIRVIELSRNFGHHPAILAGLREARGGRVFYLDSDLEEAPEYLQDFSRRLDEVGCDVVFGLHPQTEGSVMRRLSSRAFWRLFNVLSDTRTHPDICNIRLMSRSYVDALLAMPERNVFLGGMFAWPGFRQEPLRVERTIRRHRSTYGWWKRCALFARSIVAFSTRPLEILFAVGSLIAAAALASALAITIEKLLRPETIIRGYTALLVSIWLLSGLILASLGLVGLYIAYMYHEVKGRPRTVVRQVHHFPGSPE